MKTSFLTGAALTALFLAPATLPADAAVRAVVGKPAPTQSVDFVVHLPLRNIAQLEQLTTLQGDRNSPLYHHFLTPAQFRASFGPTPQTMGRAAQALGARGLAVTKTETQLLHVRGAVAKIEAAFGTHLGVVRDEHGRLGIAAPQVVTVPSDLSALGASVAGLAFTHRPEPLARRVPLNRQSIAGGYWFTDLKQAYQYPAYATANGAGVTIATVGVSDYNTADATLYFNHEKLGGSGALGPIPNLQRVVFPGGGAFDPNNGASDEANLDVQQSGGSAPGATIVGIDIPPAPNETFMSAYSYIDETNAFDIVSTSYGECELYYTAPYNGGIDQTGILQAYHQLFLQGNSQGITFVFSSGDNAPDCFPVGYFGPPTGAKFNALAGAGIWVDDPNVTSVGGTNLITTYDPPTLKSSYVSQNAYSDVVTVPFDVFGTGNFITNYRWGSGNGASTIFAKPAFQRLVNTGANTRYEPDVSMHMGGCPFYGPTITIDCGTKIPRSYDIAYIGGQAVGLIGTSASSPEFAGLLAVKESIQKSRLGNENVDLYTLAKANNAFPYAFFRQGIPGNNGLFSIPPGQPGYSKILGVGTPIGLNFAFTPYSTPAGDPQTPTNP